MRYSISLDVGTTNIQALLIERRANRWVDSLSIKNSQVVYGSDVITRLGQSLKSDEIREGLRSGVLKDLELVLGLLLKRNSISIDLIDNVVACGNSAMHHILLGLPLENLAWAPFRPGYIDKLFRSRLGEIGVSGFKDIPFLFLPNLGGFVGSDALCVIIDTHIPDFGELILSIDLGTNGEIVLGSRSRIVVASTSAGPAFEDWRIKCGVHGSTLIDIISAHLVSGEIDKSGYVEKGNFVHHSANSEITVNQKDVREFQLAKAAISTGIRILRRRFSGEKISKCYITGIFGCNININNAKEIGIIPADISLENIALKGSSALYGAGSLSQYDDIGARIGPILEKIEHVELHKEPGFQEVFAQGIGF